MITAKDISQQLSQRAEQVARHLLPKGQRSGNEWVTGSVGGDEGKSCKVCVSGEKAGVWCDFATGDSGDLLDLWASNRSVSLGEAIAEAKEFLGVRDVPRFEPRAKTYRKPATPKCVKPTPLGGVGKYLTQERKLTTEAIAAYQIGESGSKIVFPYLRNKELVFVKYLDINRDENGKKIITVEKDCEPSLFGWQAIPERSRFVTICEGEVDAMTLWQYQFPALSVPFGGGGKGKHAWIETEFDRLQRFDTIFLCFDGDAEGEAAVLDVSERLGRHRCKIVRLPHKDANECLQKGVTNDEILGCFLNAKTLDPDGLRAAEEFVGEVIGEFYPVAGKRSGFAPPWLRAADKVQFRPAELSVWTGVSGHGKTMLLNQIMLQAMREGERVCIASLEIKPRRLLYRMVRQATTQALPDEQTIRNAHDWFAGKLWLFDYVGSAKGDWILEIFKYARLRYGVSQFVIDSLMKCGMSEDDYNAQKLFVEKLADFKNEHNVHVHLVAHARKAADEDRIPGKLDVKGTGTLTDMADNTFTVWRNKKKEDSVMKQNAANMPVPLDIREMPDAMWMCDKQRNGEWEGKIALWWEPRAFQYLDSDFSEPINYLGLNA